MAFFKASSSISAESRVRMHSLCAKTVHNTASCITWCTTTVIVRICRCRKFCLSSLKLLLLKDKCEAMSKSQAAEKAGPFKIRKQVMRRKGQGAVLGNPDRHCGHVIRETKTRRWRRQRQQQQQQ